MRASASVIPPTREAGVQFPERGGEAVEVGPFSAYHAVGILGRPSGAIGIGGRSTDDQVLDLVAVQDSIRRGRSCDGPSMLDIGGGGGLLGALCFYFSQPLHHGLA